MESKSSLEDVSIGSRLLLICWPLYGISGILIMLRLIAKAKYHLAFALEDLLVILAMISGICHISLNTWGISFGLGRHIMFLTETQAAMAIRAEFIGEPFGIISPTLGRISFAVYLLRILGHQQNIRRFLYFLIAQNAIINLMALIQIFFECSDISYNWNRVGHEDQCWSMGTQAAIGYFQGSSSSLTDLVLTILPVAMVINLHIPMHLKLLLSFLLGVSLFAFIAAVIRTYCIMGSNDDITFTSVRYIIWCAVENCTVIITSSIPFLRPLFRSAPKPYIEVKNSPTPKIIQPNEIEYRNSREILADPEAIQEEIDYLGDKKDDVNIESHSLV
ncbi:uncharacterized protein EAF01_004485 [Botrytis porri]|uniref:uncharacterized protein n=1 Tax=Botrytis porri TaxID=87229 RepID=UPI0019001FB3|nr:uncharacterized protein EAF01_004485 [Botrytis porri]KAF7908730.1 hypothetical protein EAF01_004485 [Botrytis porri]